MQRTNRKGGRTALL